MQVPLQATKEIFFNYINFHSHNEKETTRLTFPHEATKRTKQGETKKNTHTGMNKSATLTHVQGPSTIVCMIVT